MTAPKKCEHCGANLDAGETCTCQNDTAVTAETTAVTGSMEFVMGKSLEALPQTIDFNFEQLKAGLSASLTTYTGLVVTEDSIKSAKEDRAKLNKLREALETKRKEVKKQCMAPYNDFEAKVKELVGLIDKPIAAIDGQLQQFEEIRRNDKYAAVLAVYEETVGVLRGILPFEKVWRDEWYNTGVSMKKIRDAIVSLESKVASDLDVLSTVESEFADAVKVKYLEAFDLNAALTERKRLQDEAEKLRQYNARKEAFEKLEAAAPPKPEEPAEDPPSADCADGTPASAPEAPAAPEAPEGVKVYRLRFECGVTMDQASALSAWLKANNIEYRRI